MSPTKMSFDKCGWSPAMKKIKEESVLISVGVDVSKGKVRFVF